MNIEIAYNAFCEERFPLPSEDQVTAIEDRIHMLLPPDYRQFLLDYNGGIFSEPDIVLPGRDPLDGLTFMAGIEATHPCAELATPYALSLFDDNDPLQILPIGGTPMGSLILLVTNPEDQGCILLKRAFSDETFLLGENMEEFFALLRKPPTE